MLIHNIDVNALKKNEKEKDNEIMFYHIAI